MQNTCSCPNGVDSTQRIVTYALFGSNIFGNDNNLKSTRKQISEKEIKRATMIRSKTNNSDSLLSNIFNDKQSTSKETLLIHISTDLSNLQQVKWQYAQLYNSQQFNNDILGYKELMKGLPTIYLSWRNSNSEIDMQQLFGFKDRIPISRFFSDKKEKNN